MHPTHPFALTAYAILVFSATAALAADHQVRVISNRFVPSDLVIQEGDSVTWTNEGGGHNVNATSGASFRCAVDCGANGAPSPQLWSVTLTFDDPTFINYRCDAHFFVGMVGTIDVQDAGTTPEPGQIRFTDTLFVVDEDDGTATVSAERVNGSDDAASVMFMTMNGSAVAGSDYTTSSGMLSWGDGQTGARTFTVPILDDAVPEGNETLSLMLSNPSGATLVAPSTTTLRIRDDDETTTDPGTLSFSQAAYAVGEDAGDAEIAVERTGGTDGTVSVEYMATDGSAIAGADYEAAAGTLTWPDGDGADKTFEVPILDDAAAEDEETVNLSLAMPTGGSTLGPTSAATLSISDNDLTVEPCVPDETTLCLGKDGRFTARVSFTAPDKEPDQAQVVDIGKRDSGLFFFFDENNIEMLVKVLNGCSITNHFWVFYAATTNVEFTLTVTDTEAGVVKRFMNSQGQRADAVLDTSAFATCP